MNEEDFYATLRRKSCTLPSPHLLMDNNPVPASYSTLPPSPRQFPRSAHPNNHHNNSFHHSRSNPNLVENQFPKPVYVPYAASGIGGQYSPGSVVHVGPPSSLSSNGGGRVRVKMDSPLYGTGMMGSSPGGGQPGKSLSIDLLPRQGQR